jgi:hypothetical protein
MSIQAGTIGADIQYTVLDDDGAPKDISLATVKKLVFRKPDAEEWIVTADFLTDGTNGILRYLTMTALDLSPPGNYRVQADLTMPGFTGRTGVDLFSVSKNV